eukprot:352524_1
MEVINSSISPQRAEGHSEIHSCQSVNPTPGGPHVTSDTSSATRNHNSNSNNEINEHGKRALNDPNDHNPQPPKRQRTESHHQELLYTTPEFIRAICEGGKIDESLLLRIQSKHTKYNSARPWKLFSKDDPMFVQLIDRNTDPHTLQTAEKFMDNYPELCHREATHLKQSIIDESKMSIEDGVIGAQLEAAINNLDGLCPEIDVDPFVTLTDQRGTKKVHKSAIITRLFNENTGRLVTDRQLLVQNVLKNVKKRPLQTTLNLDGQLCIVVGQHALGLVALNNRLHCCLLQLKTIGLNGSKVTIIPMNALDVEDNVITFKFLFCLDVKQWTEDAQGDGEDTKHIEWGGNVSTFSITLKPFQCIFPSFASNVFSLQDSNDQNDERNTLPLISTTCNDLLDYANLIRSSNTKSLYLKISSSIAERVGVPYDACLSVCPYTAKKRSKSRKERDSAKNKNAKKKQTIANLDESRLCNICISNGESNSAGIALKDFPLHVMGHVVKNEAQPFKEDDDGSMSFLCYFCGSMSMEMCDLKCVRTTSSDFKNTITTNCVTGYIGTRYWGSLSKVTETNAYSNAPKLCPVANCAKNIWRWNLKHHMIHNHDIDEEDIAEQHIVSKFELLCVQYQMKASYIGKDDFNNLMQKHKTKTKELFKKRYEKQQQMIEKAKAKQQRKDDQKSRSQIRKSNRNRSITQRKPKTNAKRNVDATDEEPQSTNNANTNSKQEMDASGDDADEEPQNTNNATNAKQDVDDMKQDVDDTKQDVDDTPVHHHAMDKEDEDEEEDDDAALWKTKRKKTMILRDDDTSEEEEQEEEQYWDDDSDDTNDVVMT